MIFLGNTGSGKSTLARIIMSRQAAARLYLDEVAFQDGTERRPLEVGTADVKLFMADNKSWIIEGCYSDIIEAILGDCEELIFLNPGVDVCIAHCRARPWKPEKFSSKAEHDDNLENLIYWVAAYEVRSDEYELSRHREIYDAFTGKKAGTQPPE